VSPPSQRLVGAISGTLLAVLPGFGSEDSPEITCPVLLGISFSSGRPPPPSSPRAIFLFTPAPSLA